NFTRAVGGDDDDGPLLGTYRANFRHRDLIIRQQFQQIGFEWLVGAIELVDQQYRRTARGRFQRLQQRPAHEKARIENFAAEFLAIGHAFRFGQANFDHLPRVVPLVDCRTDVQAFVALQPDQLAPERPRQYLRDFGLADTGLSFQK